jgi:puromycin-sensitive aminopeptidase
MSAYCKGGSVVRMIHAVLGMDHFRQGLENYMKKHQYGNTETFDLWQAWENVSGLPIKEMMASWTEQMGFPLLEIVSEDWQEHEVTLTVKQSWFLSDGSDVPAEEAKKWCIPIMTTTASGAGSDITFMREETATVKVSLDGPEGWVKLNAGQEVPMRVSCSSKMLERLAIGIKTKSLPVTDRAGLLGDAYALVKAGKMKPEDLIKLLSHYSAETDAVVWESMETVLLGLDSIMSGGEPDMHANFQAMARKLVQNLLNVVSWESSADDGHLTALLRTTMVNLLAKFCYAEDKVKSEANTRYQKFQEDASDMQALPSDMRASVFKIILKNGGAVEYNAIKSYFTSASDNAERKHVLGSIGNTSDPALKKQTLEWAISGDIKLQDFFYPIGSVGGSSPEGREIAWQFFQDNFDKIKAMVDKASPSIMGAVIVMCCSGFATQARADEIQNYFEVHPLPKNARKIAQILEGMSTNAKFLDKLKASDLANKSFWDSLE